MKHTLTTLAVATAVVFGLTACSGSEAPVEAEVSTETAAPIEEVAPSETGGLDQGTVQACLDMAGPMQEANIAMLEKLGDGKTPPQEVVDMYSDLANAIGKIADTTSTPEVKAAASAAHTDFTALRDAMQKVYVEGDMSSMGEYATAASAVQESYTALLELCSA